MPKWYLLDALYIERNYITFEIETIIPLRAPGCYRSNFINFKCDFQPPNLDISLHLNSQALAQDTTNTQMFLLLFFRRPTKPNSSIQELSFRFQAEKIALLTELSIFQSKGCYFGTISAKSRNTTSRAVCIL